VTAEEKITEAGRGLGFVAVGFAAVGPSQTLEKFNSWLSRGFHAEMDFLPRHAALRADPRKIAPWAKSVVVAAARYPVNRTPGSGISTYARGSDYHEVLHGKLLELAAVVRRECHASQARVCVDATPLPEREWAARAGIGWIGKQGQIVNPQFGACLLLGELLVDAVLKPSPLLKNACGDCRRCVDGCPTHAIGEDGTVDAGRCISYLTVEHKGDLPEEMRPLMGRALFGCDFCTSVCPWNQRGEGRVMRELGPRPTPSPEDLLRMQESEFQTRFRHTPLLRTGLERLRRNAAVALGNGGSAAAAAVLEQAVASGSPAVQSHAAWALDRIRRTLG
jgi:epoxyqueuosine reductase